MQCTRAQEDVTGDAVPCNDGEGGCGVVPRKCPGGCGESHTGAREGGCGVRWQQRGSSVVGTKHEGGGCAVRDAKEIVGCVCSVVTVVR